MDFISDWVSWSNFFYLIGLIIAGYATTVTAKNRQIVKEIGDLVKALESGYKDNKFDQRTSLSFNLNIKSSGYLYHYGVKR